MPKVKRFEVMTMEIDPDKFLLGVPGLPFKTKHVNAFELAAQCYTVIITPCLEYLDQDKTLFLESTRKEDPVVYRIQRKSDNCFAFHSSETESTYELDMIGVLNFLFKHAPYIPVVGTSNENLTID